MINQEVRKQQFDRLKKKALLVFTTALRAPLFMMLGCGVVQGRGEVNDFLGHRRVKFPGNQDPVPYDEAIHGPITGWLEQGDEITELATLVGKGNKAVHDHKAQNFFGPYLFKQVKRE